MSTETVYALGASQISISGGGGLGNSSQGSGSHLVGKTITLNTSGWEAVQITDDDLSFGDNDGSQRLDGNQSFDGQTYSGNSTVEAEYKVIAQGPDGTTYELIGFNINQGGSGNSYSSIEGLACLGGSGGFPPPGVPLTIISAEDYPSALYTDLDAPPCFTTGCRIETPHGPVAIESLNVGDRVCTMDNGFQPIRWIGRSLLPEASLAQNPDFRPVLIRKGAFGEHCPDRDIHLSPQHRVMIGDSRAQLYFGEAEILVPIKKLMNHTTIRPRRYGAGITYFHLLFDRHEIIWSDGLASESLLPEDVAMQTGALGADARLVLSGPPRGIGGTWAARTCISDKRINLLAAA